MIKSYTEWLNEGKIPDQGETVKFMKDVPDVQTYTDQDLNNKHNKGTILKGQVAEVVFVDAQGVILHLKSDDLYIQFGNKEYKYLPIEIQ